ncbi:MAG TPA: hypothetical protein VF173_28335 [Thermoanaerobaculia bacterium]|nr:hypothetical protein [Thermoanaerobaculia bacterium]
MAKKESPVSESKNDELAELLKEVRAMRQDIEALKANPAVAQATFEPSYEVLVAAQRKKLPPNYAVLARPSDLSPNYQVAVRALRPDESVVAKVAYPPNYAVAVRQGALPPEYEVAVRGPFKNLEDPLAAKTAAKSAATKSAAAKKKK